MFGSKSIPLISPIPIAEWPQSAVELLLKASNGECRLGTFQFSTGQGSVDHVVFEMNIPKKSQESIWQKHKDVRISKFYSRFDDAPTFS